MCQGTFLPRSLPTKARRRQMTTSYSFDPFSPMGRVAREFMGALRKLVGVEVGMVAEVAAKSTPDGPSKWPAARSMSCGRVPLTPRAGRGQPMKRRPGGVPCRSILGFASVVLHGDFSIPE